MDEETDAAPQVVFRPSKKRKQFRQRAEDTTEDPKAASTATTTTAAAATTTEAATVTTTSAPEQDSESAANKDSETSGTEGGGLSVAEALRLRNARRSKLKGVEFRAESSTAAAAMAEEQQLLSEQQKDDLEEAIELGVSRRFAPQAGLVGELVNKHMEEYIESELARRFAADKAAQDAAATALQQQQHGSSSGASGSGGGASSSSSARVGPTGDRPTKAGKLFEVDLGDEMRMRNAAMTEQARRRLAGEAIDEEPEGSSRQPRIGKDGKPWRPRKRRASDDVQRDQLVEELMRENKLDVYDVPAEPESSAGLGEDEPADARIASNFRREFLRAMAERRQMRRRAPVPANRRKNRPNPDEILRGPKLGGSRNARAAMRDVLLAQQQEKNKRR